MASIPAWVEWELEASIPAWEEWELEASTPAWEEWELEASVPAWEELELGASTLAWEAMASTLLVWVVSVSSALRALVESALEGALHDTQCTAGTLSRSQGMERTSRMDPLSFPLLVSWVAEARV